MIKQVLRFETTDGKLFNTEEEAKEHRENQIGELLDSIFPHDERGNVTMSDRYNIFMQMMNPKNRRLLAQQVKELNDILNSEWVELDIMSDSDRDFIDQYR